MSEHREPIPSMIYNAAVGGHVTNSQQIIDENENKEQSQINAEVKQTLGQGGSVDARIDQAKTDIIGGASSNGNTLKKIEDRVSPLESAVGTGGSVDSRISAAVATETTRAQAAEEQLRTLYNNLQQSQPIPVTELPATGEAGKIYRLAGTTSYADYMYAEGALTTPIKMAEYDNAIDDEPTAGSDNLVKSGGIKAEISKNSYEIGNMELTYQMSQGYDYMELPITLKMGTKIRIESTTAPSVNAYTVKDSSIYYPLSTNVDIILPADINFLRNNNYADTYVVKSITGLKFDINNILIISNSSISNFSISADSQYNISTPVIIPEKCQYARVEINPGTFMSTNDKLLWWIDNGGPSGEIPVSEISYINCGNGTLYFGRNGSEVFNNGTINIKITASNRLDWLEYIDNYTIKNVTSENFPFSSSKQYNYTNYANVTGEYCKVFITNINSIKTIDNTLDWFSDNGNAGKIPLLKGEYYINCGIGKFRLNKNGYEIQSSGTISYSIYFGNEIDEYGKSISYQKPFDMLRDSILSENVPVTLHKNYDAFNCTLNAVISWTGNFGTIKFGQGLNNEFRSLWIEINNSILKGFEITVINGVIQQNEVINTNHNLSLTTPLSLSITSGVLDNGVKKKVITITNGDGNQKQEIYYGDGLKGIPFILENGFSSAVKVDYFSCTSDYKQPIWIYGDSYFESFWLKQFIINGYKQYRASFRGGLASNDALEAVCNDLLFGKPKVIFWAIGMNDKDDKDSIIYNNWLENCHKLERLCKTNNIELVYGTIPSVAYNGDPINDNHLKNNYIRTSGYRYVEIAAYLEDGNGIWRTGLKGENDDVHPSPYGNNVIIGVVMSQLPEICGVENSKLWE